MLLKKKEPKHIADQSKWWGYLHTNGTIQVKAYYSPVQIEDARESTFVRFIVPPFKSNTREEATILIIKEIEDVKRMQEGFIRPHRSGNYSSTSNRGATTGGLKRY